MDSHEAVAADVTGPDGQLDQAIGDRGDLALTPDVSLVEAINEVLAHADTIGGGATVTDTRLVEWTEGESYALPSPTPHGTYPNLPASGSTVEWPDGSAGVLTIDTIDTTWEAISAYHITHTDSSKTVTQVAITRDSNGFPTVKPLLTVA